MSEGISHHPLLGNAPPIPQGHTRVCHAGAMGAADRAVREEWNPQGRYYGPAGRSEEAYSEVLRRAWASMVDGTQCNCRVRHPGKTRGRRR